MNNWYLCTHLLYMQVLCVNGNGGGGALLLEVWFKGVFDCEPSGRDFQSLFCTSNQGQPDCLRKQIIQETREPNHEVSRYW